MLTNASKKGIREEVELLELILEISKDERTDIFYYEGLNTLEEYRNYLKNEFNAEVIFGE
jgi:hypothetical protein